MFLLKMYKFFNYEYKTSLLSGHQIFYLSQLNFYMSERQYSAKSWWKKKGGGEKRRDFCHYS